MTLNTIIVTDEKNRSDNKNMLFYLLSTEGTYTVRLLSSQRVKKLRVFNTCLIVSLSQSSTICVTKLCVESKSSSNNRSQTSDKVVQQRDYKENKFNPLSINTFIWSIKQSCYRYI